ncbi:MAG: lysylphosphatidylglycerol synthase domain-containing protein [Candidatus Saccharimonadales bacterium]
MPKKLLLAPKHTKIIKYCLIATIITATFIIFGFYINGHPEVIDTLKNLSPDTLVLLTIGYTLITTVNAFVLYYSLRFIKKSSTICDNIILTGYSSIVNFFGPLQSGPGFRAIYLKKKYGVNIRDFFITTLIFYGFFGLINAAIIATASAYKFGSGLFYAITLIALALLTYIVYLVDKRFNKIRPIIKAVKLDNKNFWLIGVGSIGLTLATTATYFIEIYHINTGISIVQTLVYSAAANLSIFVAITPGAIGIRESFLALSQQLHGIDTTTIVGASVIDRAFYIGFLALIFIILLAINSRKHLSIFNKTKSLK